MLSKRYWHNLKNHPGVPVAFLLNLLGIIAGLKNPSFSALNGAIFGLAVTSLFWIPVLLTANQKGDKNEQD